MGESIRKYIEQDIRGKIRELLSTKYDWNDFRRWPADIDSFTLQEHVVIANIDDEGRPEVIIFTWEELEKRYQRAWELAMADDEDSLPQWTEDEWQEWKDKILPEYWLEAA